MSWNLPYKFPACYGMRLRRHKLHIIRFRASTKTHSFRCSSSPQKVLRLFGVPENLSHPWVFLPFCLNAVPAPVSGGVLFLLVRSCLGDTSPKKHIPFSRSFNFQPAFWATKKPAHKCVPTICKRIEYPPCNVGFTFM